MLAPAFGGPGLLTRIDVLNGEMDVVGKPSFQRRHPADFQMGEKFGIVEKGVEGVPGSVGSPLASAMPPIT